MSMCDWIMVTDNGVQAIYPRLNTVRFFYAKLGSTGQNRLTYGTGSSNKQRREFINRQWHLIFRHMNAFKRTRTTNTDVCNRFTASNAFIFNGNVRTHLFQDFDHASTGRVEIGRASCRERVEW